MATPPSSQKKKGRKQTRRSLQNSPSTRYLQWVPLLGSPNALVPSSKKDQYGDIQIDNGVSPSSLPGGLISVEGRLLYASTTSTATIDIGEHVPIRSDSILLHPLTMEALGVAIATSVLVENMQATACRVWPCVNLSLDVVGVGSAPLLSVGCVVGGMVKISPLAPGTTLVAGQLDLEPTTTEDSAADELLLTRTFQSYLLHMHTGYSVCPGGYLSVQYYGEERVLQIKSITPLDPADTSNITPIKEKLSEQFSTLSLTSDPQKTEPLSAHSSLNTSVYKITAKTKIIIQSKENSPNSSSSKTKDHPSLSSFAGAQRQVQLLRELVLYPLQHHKSSQSLSFPRGVLLYGPPGVGKSLLARCLSNETQAHTMQLSASQLSLGNQDSEGKIQEAFSEAKKHAPTLLVLDDLHVLCPHRNSAPSESERRSTAALITCLDSLEQAPRHIVVVATTNQIEGVEPSLRRPGRFDREVEIHAPSARERRDILYVHLKTMKDDISEEQLTVLANSAHGYVGADLLAVCVEAQHKALHRALNCEGVEDVRVVRVCVQDMQDALREIRPSAMREVAIEVPEVYWTDIGGQESVKQRMREAVEWPLKHPESFKRLGVRPPRGVLLFGPPGCSKTMVARALATESGLNFIAVKGPELFSKWVGDSERAVRQVFSRARAAAPAIIFFDEIDALAVQRKSEGSSVADRVLAQLLTEMDGVESLSDVLVVAATNRPDMIDKALLRPGRIDRMIYVPLPDDNTRRQILNIQFRKMPVAEDVRVDSLVAHTEGYSGAEIVSLCQEAALCAMHEDITCSLVSHKHFMEAFDAVQPQTDKTTIEFYEKYISKR
ncbi:ATPase family gene 2 protein homolog A-like [Halichondria panicea]|uniref:ATPase family gene 2 protein homolog A-like n=1 Tax=Halichondria panicea TaxID=6063 RepID=UPI00312BAD7C